MPDFTTRVYDLVRCVPRGRVVPYGGIAAMLGHPRAARGVGQALKALPADSDVPWWRVVNRNGEVSIRAPVHAAALQRTLLRREGVRFDRHGRIDWRRFGWTGEREENGAGVTGSATTQEPSS
jgi:methylated-DNA-protein-cysteine methyltransferase related protein